jgi:hypothetical protein
MIIDLIAFTLPTRAVFSVGDLIIYPKGKALPSAQGTSTRHHVHPENHNTRFYPMSEKFIIALRGTEFRVHLSQIEFDGPNYFTSHFLANSKQRRIELYRDPDLFRIVISYLSGYNVFPLDERSIPPTMSPNTVLQNLRSDAVFYQLHGLVQLCDKFIEQERVKKTPQNQYLVLGNVYRCHFSVEFGTSVVQKRRYYLALTFS